MATRFRTPEALAQTVGDRLLRDTEVAEILGVSRRMVWLLVRSGELAPPVRIGTRLARWRASDVQRAIRMGFRANEEA